MFSAVGAVIQTEMSDPMWFLYGSTPTIDQAKFFTRHRNVRCAEGMHRRVSSVSPSTALFPRVFDAARCYVV